MLGAEHLDTLISMANLIWILHKSRSLEAGKLFMQVVETAIGRSRVHKVQKYYRLGTGNEGVTITG